MRLSEDIAYRRQNQLVIFGPAGQNSTMESKKSSRRTSSSRSYKILGRTSDGVEILKPKMAPTHFTTGELKTMVERMIAGNKKIVPNEARARHVVSGTKKIPKKKSS